MDWFVTLQRGVCCDLMAIVTTLVFGFTITYDEVCVVII